MEGQDRRCHDRGVGHFRSSSHPSHGLDEKARLAQLVTAGASSHRAVGATYALVAALRAQGESWREQLDALQAEIDDGIASAVDFVDKVDVRRDRSCSGNFTRYRPHKVQAARGGTAAVGPRLKRYRRIGSSGVRGRNTAGQPFWFAA